MVSHRIKYNDPDLLLAPDAFQYGSYLNHVRRTSGILSKQVQAEYCSFFCLISTVRCFKFFCQRGTIFKMDGAIIHGDCDKFTCIES